MKLVSQLLEEDEDDLLAQLGAASLALSADPSALETGALGTVGGLERMLGEDDSGFLKSTGQRILKRTSTKLHHALCEDGNEEAQKSLRATLADNKTAFATLLVTFLVQLGITSAIALIVAAIIANALFEATFEVLCERWAEYNQAINA